MKPIPDCVPDALNMILATARAVSDDDFIHRKVLLKVMGEIADDGDLGSNAADIYLQSWQIACRALGVKDPYENEKARGDKTALGLLRILAEQFPCPPADALPNAVRISFAGAMLDFNVLGRSDMQEKIDHYYRSDPVHDDSQALLTAIDRAQSVMLVTNRAGEIVMDKPLVEAMADLGKQVYVAVSARPVFLMATEKDAENSGFSERITVTDPGTAMYGLVQERASSEFQDLFEDVDLIIVKGCVHYSTISPHRELYYILKASQREVADELGVACDGGAIVRVPGPEN